MMTPYFSICIPNYNYERYLGVTIDSVLSQDVDDLEILVSDNASTDGSAALVQGYQEVDPRIRLRRNVCNVGFAGNLAKASSMAVGRFMIMLSSDDLMASGALKAYRKIFDSLGQAAGDSIVNSAVSVIDSSGNIIGEKKIDWKLWRGAVKDDSLSSLIDAPVYVIDAEKLLGNSLRLMRVPFFFLSTVYSKKLCDEVEGYSQGGLFNPDKRFAWAILARARKAYIIDAPLFQYRVHSKNQTALQANNGTLKHMVDEYVATFSVDQTVLNRAGLKREELVTAFVEHDIALRGLKCLAEGKRELSRRMVDFGKACYPKPMTQNRKAWMLRIALMFGPMGTLAARLAMAPARRRWEKNILSTPVQGGHQK